VEPDAPRAAKAALRSRLLEHRATLPPEWRAAASAAICERLARLPQLAAVRALLGYAAFGAEVDVDPLLADLRSRGAETYLPWVDGQRLEIARVAGPGDLVRGWRGVREPRARHRAPRDRLDVVIVPGVAFDLRGGRLGYGGGHFDRLLGELPPRTAVLGVAFEVQVVVDLAWESHDHPVDAVVTERRVIAGRLPRPGTLA
jgi:5-formyltetrahydrofolate cyclo-ligase